MGEKKRERTELYNQRIVERRLSEEISNCREKCNFEKLVRAGMIIPEKVRGSNDTSE